MEISLKLKNYCIKTAAKKKHEKLLGRYLNNKYSYHEKSVLEVQMEALRFFLENADFQVLRSVYTELSGCQESSVSIRIPENKQDMEIVCNGRIIKTKWKHAV
jgi:hypothetical protein